MPPDELMPQVHAFARRLVSAPPLALRLIRRGVYQCAAMDLESSLELTSSHMAVTRTSEDHQEAVSAFLEKRTPVYRGR
jgi:2-(1,2-epoxy-1,2-dihydrophenyl)acetyl-CoA isomerase